MGKTFIPLENNPQVMTKLAHELGLSSSLEFIDVYSLTDSDILSFVPRPVLALLFIYPCTETSEKFFGEEHARDPEYNGSGPDEPVMFYYQTIEHACGLIGLLHCITNGPAASLIKPGSDLDNLVKEAIHLQPKERSQLIHDSEMLEVAHSVAADTGDTVAPPLGEDPGHAFITFVKGKDGHLYELEGRRKGPVDRGLLPESADMLSEAALRVGPLPFLEREQKAGSGRMGFSCIALIERFSD